MNNTFPRGPMFKSRVLSNGASFQNMPYHRMSGPRPYGQRPAHYDQWNHNFNRTPSTKEELFCETCDKGFMTENQLQIHKQQHQKCNIDGCQFVAHPKIITKHIQMQHSTGLYKKICKLDNPEEVKKWREERKKKYPTQENIEKKNAEIKEKIERGERMGLNRNRKDSKPNTNPYRSQNFNEKQQHPSKRRFNQNSTNIRNNNQHKSQNLQKEKKQRKVFDQQLPVVEETIKLIPFSGIQSLAMDSDIEDEIESLPKLDINDDDITENIVEEKYQEPAVCGALSSLICNYGSSDNEEETVNKEPITKQTAEASKHINANNNKEKNISPNIPHSQVDSKDELKKIVPNDGTIGQQNRLENEFQKHGMSDDGDSGPEEIKKNTRIPENEDKQNAEAITNNKNKPKAKVIQRIRDHRYHRRPFRRQKPKLPSTLLEKLLHRDMCHERNVILQCVRYVVKNNYFNS